MSDAMSLDITISEQNISKSVQVSLGLGQMSLNKACFDEAFRYFEIAARSGHPMALNMLGRAYERGWGVQRNTRQARLYFTSAMDKGDGWAAFNLADLYFVGDGVPVDRPYAYRLYVQAAEKGVLKALNMLGLLHEDGILGEPDHDGAQHFYRAAFERGDGWGGLNLARLALACGACDSAQIYLDRILQEGTSDMICAAYHLIYDYPGEIFRDLASTMRCALTENAS